MNPEAEPRITALVPEPARVARLRSAFGDNCRMSGAQPELIAASRRPGVDLVVVSPLDGDGRSLTTTVAAIRASRRSPPIHVYGDRSAECIRELMPLARAGARGVIVAGIDDDVTSLRRLLRGGTVQQAVDSVTLAVHQVVATRHVPLFVHCLEQIAEPPTAGAFARHLGVSRRTLSAWAHKAGARGVRSLRSRCRVLVAIEMLRDPGRVVEQVAHELSFSSSAHLHNTIRRYTGLRPRETSRHSPADWCAVLFDAPRTNRLPAGESPPPPAEWSVPPNGPIFPPDEVSS